MTNGQQPHEETYIPTRLPIWIIFAALAPTLLIALLRVVKDLGGPTLAVDRSTLFLVWLFTTIPLALFAIGARGLIRRDPKQGIDPEVQAALEALVRAEQMAMRHAETLAKMDAILADVAQRRQTASGSPIAAQAPTPEAGRSRTMVLAGVAGFLLLAGAVAYGFTLLPTTEVEHIHPSFAVFVNGERVNYTHMAFDLSERGVINSHLHYPDQVTMHVEGPPGQTLAEFFRNGLDTVLTPTSIRLDNLVHGGVEYENNETHTLRLYVQNEGSDEWRQVSSILTYIPRDNDRILVTFGNETGGALQAQMDVVPDATYEERVAEETQRRQQEQMAQQQG